VAYMPFSQRVGNELSFFRNIMLFIYLLHLFKSIDTSNTTLFSILSINTRKSDKWCKYVSAFDSGDKTRNVLLCV